MDRDGLDLVDRIHDLVRDLDLNLVTDAGLGVGPVSSRPTNRLEEVAATTERATPWHR